MLPFPFDAKNYFVPFTHIFFTRSFFSVFHCDAHGCSVYFIPFSQTFKADSPTKYTKTFCRIYIICITYISYMYQYVCVGCRSETRFSGKCLCWMKKKKRDRAAKQHRFQIRWYKISKQTNWTESEAVYVMKCKWTQIKRDFQFLFVSEKFCIQFMPFLCPYINNNDKCEYRNKFEYIQNAQKW